MDKKRHNNSTASAIIARQVRIANYRKLIAAMQSKSLTIEQMAALIGIELSTASRYHKAMLRAGVTQRVAGRFGPRMNCRAYARLGDDAAVERFLSFIANCEAVEDEIGHPRRRTASVDIGEFGSRVIVKTKAQQCGMLRDSLVAALFGAAGVVA